MRISLLFFNIKFGTRLNQKTKIIFGSLEKEEKIEYKEERGIPLVWIFLVFSYMVSWYRKDKKL